MSRPPLLAGLDGGGSGCRVRLCDGAGRTLGEGESGPANLTTGFDAAILSVQAALGAALVAAGLPAEATGRIRLVAGLAGASARGDGRRLQADDLGVAALHVVSDTEIACIGAHAGNDGAILVLGTGSQGLVMRAGEVRRVGGWGFLLSDDGSGAVLGREALRAALAALEGLGPVSPFTLAVADGFGGQPLGFLDFARSARPADYARHAPTVFAFADRHDPVACAIVSRQQQALLALADRLALLGGNRLALAGGLSALWRPHLCGPLAGRLVEAEGQALDGALWLARRAFAA